MSNIKKTIIQKERLALKVPIKFCLYDGKFIKDTLKFISDLESSTIVEHKLVKIDLSTTEFITAAAAVLLFSTITRIRGLSLNGFNSIKIEIPISGSLRTYMNKSGLLRAINIDLEKYPESIWNGKLNFVSGNDPEKDHIKLNNLIASKGQELLKLPHKLSASTSETLLNIMHHAYIPMNIGNQIIETKKFIKNRWWCCFDIYKDEGINILKCVILDRGHGICNTISSSKYRSSLRQPLEYFKIAMTTGNSRTGNPERGKGSEDIQRPIDITKNERDFLSIMSHTIMYTKLGNTDQKFDSSNHHIPGTIVEWQLEF